MTPGQYWSGFGMPWPWAEVWREMDRVNDRAAQRLYGAVAATRLPPSGDNWHSPDSLGTTGL